LLGGTARDLGLGWTFGEPARDPVPGAEGPVGHERDGLRDERTVRTLGRPAADAQAEAVEAAAVLPERNPWHISPRIHDEIERQPTVGPSGFVGAVDLQIEVATLALSYALEQEQPFHLTWRPEDETFKYRGKDGARPRVRRCQEDPS
jgi:hypothetical protein